MATTATKARGGGGKSNPNRDLAAGGGRNGKLDGRVKVEATHGDAAVTFAADGERAIQLTDEAMVQAMVGTTFGLDSPRDGAGAHLEQHGTVVHVFSHLKHTYNIWSVTFEATRPVAEPAGQAGLGLRGQGQWLSRASMLGGAFPTNMKKVFACYEKPPNGSLADGSSARGSSARGSSARGSSVGSLCADGVAATVPTQRLTRAVKSLATSRKNK
jgi:hypothetical protein